MTRDEFERMWGADPYDSDGYDEANSGCVLLVAILGLVAAAIVVGSIAVARF